MGYSYSPSSRDEQARAFFGRKGKHLAIAAAIVFLVAAFYFTGNAVTTYATYNRNLEGQLNSTQTALAAEKQQKEACDSSLEKASDKLDKCGADLAYSKSSADAYIKDIERLNNAVLNASSSLDTCMRDRDKLSGSVKNLNVSLEACKNSQTSSLESYRQLARSSVKAICCSFGDVQSGLVRNWNITNNSITCSGAFTINCTSGESNY